MITIPRRASTAQLNEDSPSQFKPASEAEIRLSAALRCVDNITDRIQTHYDPARKTEALSVPAPTANPTDATPDESNIINLSFTQLSDHPSESFAALQEWEGVVTKVKDGIVYANLVDITANETSFEEEAEIPFSEIRSEEQMRAVPGAIFRWTIGYYRQVGTLMNGSVIRFRRLAGQTKPPLPPPALVFEEHD
jgi:hypothetical protein